MLIYVAPPDRHLLLEGQKVKLVYGPKENLHRPSIDMAMSVTLAIKVDHSIPLHEIAPLLNELCLETIEETD